ncbi:transcriptional activator NhaR [Parasulfuritortus cantonensis]|uniref:Transcriptional activator NhaR n=1 Tax=Parasulfuritortus cantonensis TaxID=2528202 RepID=A0A4R1B338_9PROT|nr:transcriptional activator NhaR [Parasulfuritortus cantonensis]TCJ12261.1 transcriptional activator NhaR [Parasulfuritortus cantonensis]
MLNYKQLHYFWQVAKAGGVARAAERLHLTPQTLSGQIALLEENLGEALFRRVGRRLELTEAGQLALAYADDIFRTGGELEEVLRGGRGGRPLQFRVGIADVLPKSVAYRLLAPAMALPDPIRLVGKEDKLERLLGELAMHRLDLVLADSPMPEQAEVKGYSHKLGECGVAFLAAPALAARLVGGFPACLAEAPLLVPGEGTALRGQLMRWLAAQQLHPRVVGEFDDAALMNAFGQGGSGVFPAPALVADEIRRQYGVELLGRTDALAERFYAITVARRVSHPAVLAILENASRDRFGSAN